MKRKYLINLLLVLCLPALKTSTASAIPQPVQIEILMNPQLLDDAKNTDSFTGSFAVTSGRQIILSSENGFSLLGLGNIVDFGNPAQSISDFALTPDSLLMAIRDDELCIMDSAGNLLEILKLPYPEMGISTGKYVMYIYGRNSSATNNAIYLLEPGGRYVKLLEMPGAINDLLESDNSIVFARENAVFKFNLSTKNLMVLAAMQGNEKVLSVATDPSTERIYFSTLNEVYSVKGDTLVRIAGELGGTLAYSDGLIIFDYNNKTMVRLNADDGTMMAVEKKAVAEPVTVNAEPASTIIYSEPVTPAGLSGMLKNEDIIRFVKDGFSESLIITIINNSKAGFDLSVDSIIALSAENVSSAVIMAMRQAMKDKE